MKKMFLSSLAVLATVSAASALELTPYATVRGGYDHAIMDTKAIIIDGEADGAMGNPSGNGYMLGVAAGVSADVNKYFGIRGEVEYTYADVDLERKYMEEDEDNGELVNSKDKWKTSSNTLMLNAYVDIKTGTEFTPYIGAGLGYAWNNAKLKVDNGTYLKFDDNAFAWQIGAGVSYAVCDALSIDLGYRFMDVAGLKGSTTFAGDDESMNVKMEYATYSHQVYLGARYAF